MNPQQARIRAYLKEAADERAATGAVDLVLQTQLAEEGYPLCQLDRDLTILTLKGEL